MGHSPPPQRNGDALRLPKHVHKRLSDYAGGPLSKIGLQLPEPGSSGADGNRSYHGVLPLFAACRLLDGAAGSVCRFPQHNSVYIFRQTQFRAPTNIREPQHTQATCCFPPSALLTRPRSKRTDSRSESHVPAYVLKITSAVCFISCFPSALHFLCHSGTEPDQYLLTSYYDRVLFSYATARSHLNGRV
jgi:hypothetical protein